MRHFSFPPDSGHDPIGMLLMLFERQAHETFVRTAGVLLVLGVYSCGFLMKLFKFWSAPAVPRTEDMTDEKTYRAYRRLVYDPLQQRGGLRWIFYVEPLVWVVVFLGLLGAVLAILGGRIELAAVPASGVLMTLFCGWAWWRISETFFDFVATYGTTATEQADSPTVTAQ
jgi:hypothetical protein